VQGLRPHPFSYLTINTHIGLYPDSLYPQILGGPVVGKKLAYERYHWFTDRLKQDDTPMPENSLK
jgi:hypothetical protein